MKVPLEEGPCISYMCHVSAISREDFVREVTCEWVLNDEEELPMKGEGAALGTEEPLCG